jgi:phage shock protein A
MSQQSILGRIAQLTRANINALIDSAEDPQKMLDQIIRDYTNGIAEAEEAVAQTIGNLRMMEEDEHEASETAAEWGGKARAAAKKGRQLREAADTGEAERFDQLARVALKRQIDVEGQAKDLRGPIAQQTEVVEKLKSGLQQMRLKLDELKRTRDQLVSRARMAQAQSQVHGALRSVDLNDPTSEVARFEERIRREEARVAGQTELASSSLEAQFASLEDEATDAEVEARLAELQGEGGAESAA